jgi:argininosuccinate synthase
MARDKVILAYSGGLDTSVMVPWIGEKYGLDVVTFTVDLGQGEDINKIKQKAMKTGAVDAVAVDARNLFVDNFVFPALMAGALYEGKYPLATALGRPLIAKLMVEAARDHNAKAVAHGCTGKGNDQVRFDVTFQTLAPDLKIIAPVREWSMTRPEAIAFAAKHKIRGLVCLSHGDGDSLTGVFSRRLVGAGHRRAARESRGGHAEVVTSPRWSRSRR